MSFEETKTHASKGCQEIIRYIDERAETLGVSFDADSDACRSIFEDMKRSITTMPEYSYRQLVVITSWHSNMGRALMFETLFGELCDDKPRRELHMRKETISRAFSEFDSDNFRRDTHHSTIRNSMTQFCSEYSETIRLTADLMTTPVDENTMYEIDNGVNEILMYREDLQEVFIAAKFLSFSSTDTAWMKQVEELDPLLMRISEKNQSILRSHIAMRKEREWNLASLIRVRFNTPPEVYPMHWIGLESDKGRPLSELFGFDPAVVKGKLANIGPSTALCSVIGECRKRQD